MDVDTILCGDALAQLATLPTESVQCIVTSPPYFGLRDYGTATWEGGDPSMPDCDHQGPPMRTKAKINLNCGTGVDGKNAEAREFYRDWCGKCGATRIDQQIGLEQTPEQFIARLVAVFAEARRVLRSDGTCWVNMGDSYAGGSSGDRKMGDSNNAKAGRAAEWRSRARERVAGYKPKDLLGIPWMLAFALRADGWYLRADIIWHKPNPMPESVMDRPTKSHEYLFLLSKSPRYFYDADAIREPHAEPRTVGRWTRGLHAVGETRQRERRLPDPSGRNKRSVWTVATAPYAEAHFATFPPKLIEPCILAGSRPGDVVLDPFGGSGTVAAVARRHSRSWLGIELNPAYVEMAERRIAAEVQPVLWSSVA